MKKQFNYLFIASLILFGCAQAADDGESKKETAVVRGCAVSSGPVCIASYLRGFVQRVCKKDDLRGSIFACYLEREKCEYLKQALLGALAGMKALPASRLGPLAVERVSAIRAMEEGVVDVLNSSVDDGFIIQGELTSELMATVMTISPECKSLLGRNLKEEVTTFLETKDSYLYEQAAHKAAMTMRLLDLFNLSIVDPEESPFVVIQKVALFMTKLADAIGFNILHQGRRDSLSRLYKKWDSLFKGALVGGNIAKQLGIAARDAFLFEPLREEEEMWGRLADIMIVATNGRDGNLEKGFLAALVYAVSIDSVPGALTALVLYFSSFNKENDVLSSVIDSVGAAEEFKIMMLDTAVVTKDKAATGRYLAEGAGYIREKIEGLLCGDGSTGGAAAD